MISACKELVGGLVRKGQGTGDLDPFSHLLLLCSHIISLSASTSGHKDKKQKQDQPPTGPHPSPLPSPAAPGLPGSGGPGQGTELPWYLSW